MRRKPYWLILLLIVAISPLLALPVGADEATDDDRFLTGPNEGDPVDIATDYFQAEASTYGLTDADVADLAVRSVVPSSHTGASHVNLNQQFDGLEVFGADTTVTIAADGSVAHVGGASVGNLAVAGAVASSDAGLDAADAVEAAASELDLDEPQDLRPMRRRFDAARETVLTDGGISDEPIEARLGWQPTADGLKLAWQVVIDDATDVHLWNATVDADSGDLLEFEDWTSDSNYEALEAFVEAREGRTSTNSFVARVNAAADGPRTDVGPNDPVDDGSSYRVLQIPMDSPLDGDRVLVENPAEATASPFGWHDVSGTDEPDFTITRGNNVHAYFDQDNNNQPDPGFDVEGGPDLTFDFDADLDQHAQNYREAELTNLFYWCNVIHDVLYLYGFDEESGNFQVTNYTGEGVGGDDVRCEGADGGGTNNANFSTPAADGGRPRMQMYLWPGNQFGFQNQVVVDGVGSFDGRWARFASAPTPDGQDGEIVDGGNGCDAGQYPGDLPTGDWIAIVTSGSCSNPVKGQVAQAQGASGLIVSGGGSAGILSGSITEPTVTIPVMSLSNGDGNAVRAELPASGTVRQHPDHPGVRTGDLDNAIVIHEYGHGVSNRLTGGPGINCIGNNFNNPHRLGEAWSDYYGITMLIDPELDDFDGSRGLVPYSLFQPDRSSPGLRPRPYSRTWDIQPYSYASAASGAWLNGGSLSMPHGIGHGFNSVLMDMTWDLIDKHGFNPNLYDPWHTAGNNLALQLVTDGLKVQGCLPGQLDTRDGILVADELLTDGENQCTIWAAFARRGLGFSADQGVLSNRNDHTEAFDTHPDCREGFGPPIHADYGDLDTVEAGSNVPARFDLGSNQGLDVLAPNSPYSRRVDCETLEVPSVDPDFTTPREPPVATEQPGGSGLSVNPRGVYHYNWKTLEDWAGTCRELVLTRADGVQHRAFFEIVEPDDD